MSRVRPLLLTFLLCASAFFAFLQHAEKQSVERVAVSREQPVRLEIPRLKIDAPIVNVGLTADGHMDVPSGAFDAGWFSLGTIPGSIGNAVIAGHLDTILETNAIFWNLHQLQPGDTVIVQDSAGHSHTFQVLRLETYDADHAPLENIFGKTEERNLQLITCDGAWVERERRYNKRLVVYTRLVEESL